MKKIGITGGSGLLGKLLIKELKKVNTQYSNFNNDITNKKHVDEWLIKNKSIDKIVSLNLGNGYGINTSEVIRIGKKNYPRTNLPVPGLVGGPCLEKDPHILVQGSVDQNKILQCNLIIFKLFLVYNYNKLENSLLENLTKYNEDISNVLSFINYIEDNRVNSKKLYNELLHILKTNKKLC